MWLERGFDVAPVFGAMCRLQDPSENAHLRSKV
nr:MAG TPA: hypothetical protein [Caudoviricetes sp.]